MSVNITSHHQNFGTVGQITAQDVSLIKAQGYKSVIGNRPDFEDGPSQPIHTDIAKAVTEAGLTFAFLPVISGQYSPDQIQQMADLLESLPKPILAYCRSGARSTNLYHLAMQLG